MNEKGVRREFINFSTYMLLGITWDDCLKDNTEENNDYIIRKCASRAYLDMCRTISFHPDVRIYTNKNKDKYDFGEKGASFSENIIKRIFIPSIKRLIKLSSKDYDDTFINICDDIVNYADNMTFRIEQNGRLEEEYYLIKKPDGASICNSKKFYFGQAQKWLNMTIKYMWLLGIWDEFDNIEGVLNIPVDNYIIEAIWHEGHVENDGKLVTKGQKWNIRIPYRCGNADDNRYKKFSTDLIKPWSKWGKEEYINFQNDLRGYIGSENPLEWENTTWLAIAKKHT